MRILTEPKVYLVGRTSIDSDVVHDFLDDESATWITDTDNGAELIAELAGRVCYMSFGEKQGRRSNREYLLNIIELEHGSVLEHSVWNFIVTGASRSFTHELVRHRAGFAYSQLSQRYVDETDTNFVEPDIIARDPQLHQIWLESIRTANDAYGKLAQGLLERIQSEHPDLKGRDRRKKAREAARSVLPNATEAIMFMSANARALRHFVEYRGAPDAEPEIRRVAVAVLETMRQEAPNLFGDYETYALYDGSTAIRAEHVKV